VTDRLSPDEWEDRAIAWALEGVDQKAFVAMTTALQAEDAARFRQQVTAYQVIAKMLPDAIDPAQPLPALRERLAAIIAAEAARDVRHDELAAGIVASLADPVLPPASVKSRLMARLESQPVLLQDADGSAPRLTTAPPRRCAQAWRNFYVTLWGSLRLCGYAAVNLLRAMRIRSVVSGQPGAVTAEAKFWRHGKGLAFIAEAEGVWQEIAPGVTAKALSFDADSRRATAILRFAPGARYAPHRHTEAEELYVLQGGCSVAGRAMAVGDYHRAEAGTEHHETWTVEGCVLFVISSPQNQMLP